MITTIKPEELKITIMKEAIPMLPALQCVDKSPLKFQ